MAIDTYKKAFEFIEGVALGVQIKRKDPVTHLSAADKMLRAMRQGRRDGTMDVPMQKQMAIADRFKKRKMLV